MYVNVYSDAFELISTEYLESLNQADFLAYSSNFAEYGMYVLVRHGTCGLWRITSPPQIAIVRRGEDVADHQRE